MHDGQNLFDAPLSYAGEWQVDETMERLSAEGIEAIVVGIPNAGERRMIEYNPFDHRRFGAGHGDAYLRFLVETVKPIVDRDFRTLPQREATGVIGSSMGGLISLYAFFRFLGTFGLCGVISPSFFIGREAIYDTVRDAPYEPGRIYLDVGTHEVSSWSDDLLLHLQSRRYCQSVRRMRDLLVEKGYCEGDAALRGGERASYESAWAPLAERCAFYSRGERQCLSLSRPDGIRIISSHAIYTSSPHFAHRAAVRAAAGLRPQPLPQRRSRHLTGIPSVTPTPQPPTATPTPTRTPFPTETPDYTATPTAFPCGEGSGQIISIDRFSSEQTSENLRYKVYVPPCYLETQKRYPVVLLLHGLSYKETHWLDLVDRRSIRNPWARSRP
jgi:predicted alpha/beta superfamily hydrolase